MSGHNILVVDDEADLRDLVSYSLKKENYRVITAPDGETALAVARDKQPDLIVLDLMLPGIDGIEVCRQIRQDSQIGDTPIIMLTAKTEETDEIIGLGVGADDYITKPFSPRILVARVNSALRRRGEQAPPSAEPSVTCGDLSIHPDRHETLINGKEIKLTPIEFKILYVLAQHPGRVFTRNQIIDRALGEDIFITERTIDVHIVSLRKKLGGRSSLIETVRGVGYKFKG